MAHKGSAAICALMSTRPQGGKEITEQARAQAASEGHTHD